MLLPYLLRFAERERRRRRRLEVKKSTDSPLHPAADGRVLGTILIFQVPMRPWDFRVRSASHAGMLVRSDGSSFIPVSHYTNPRGQGAACAGLQCLTSFSDTESFLNVRSWGWAKKSRLRHTRGEDWVSQKVLRA